MQNLRGTNIKPDVPDGKLVILGETFHFHQERIPEKKDWLPIKSGSKERFYRSYNKLLKLGMDEYALGQDISTILFCDKISSQNVAGLKHILESKYMILFNFELKRANKYHMAKLSDVFSDLEEHYRENKKKKPNATIHIKEKFKNPFYLRVASLKEKIVNILKKNKIDPMKSYGYLNDLLYGLHLKTMEGMDPYGRALEKGLKRVMEKNPGIKKYYEA